MKQTIEALFSDHEFFASLINGPCRPWSDTSKVSAEDVNPAWIDDERSASVTQALHDFMKGSFPFFTTVRVIIPPGNNYDVPATSLETPRIRYVLVTILDDTSEVHHFNYSIFHTLVVAYLFTWELYRTCIKVSDWDNYINIASDDPELLVINSAQIEWVTLDLLSEDIEEPIHYKMNRYALPEIDDPVVQKILDVYKPPGE